MPAAAPAQATQQRPPAAQQRPATAQQRPAVQAQRPAPAPQQLPSSAIPVPDQLALAKLLWSTMTAVDHANKTGNYTVLRQLGSPGFQANNNDAALAATFAGIRQQRLDLSDTLLFEPIHEFAPGIVQGVLRMRGMFRMRPTGVQFDLLYQWVQGGWRLHAVALRPIPTTPGGVQSQRQQQPVPQPRN
jgi:hypothetical protein